MKIRFPIKSIWRQFNQGELFGDIWSSFNLDLTSNKGKIRISPQTVILKSGNDDSNIVYPIAFKKTLALDGSTFKWWCLGGTKLFVEQNANALDFAADATSNTPTTNHLYSDIDEFNNSLIASFSDDLAKLTSGVWTASWWKNSGQLNQSALGQNPHPVHVAFNNLLLIGDGNKLHTVDINNNVDTGGASGARITLKPELQIIWIRSSRSKIFIGCRNIAGRSAEIIEWDGQSVNFNENYKINSSECYSGIIKDDICYAINGWGELLEYNGGGFQPIDNLPILYNKLHRWADSFTIPNLVHRNGMAIINGNINILVNSAINISPYNNIENMRGGIWEYTKETGLYHRYSISKPASSKTEFGTSVMVKSGALVSLYPTIGSSFGQFLAGANLYTEDGGDVSTTIGVIVNLDSGDTVLKSGYLTTPWIPAQEVEEAWDKLWLLYTKFLSSSAKVNFKFRISKKTFNVFDRGVTGCIWTSTTSFTTTSSDGSLLLVGDEIEVISGVGAGLVAHIIAISLSSGIYTITIDETCTGATGKLTVMAFNFTKLDSIQDIVSSFKRVSISQTSPLIQFKIVMFGVGNSPEVDKIKINSEPKTVI